MYRFAARSGCAGLTAVLSLVLFAAPAQASVCKRDIPSAASLKPLIGKLTRSPQCATGGVDGQVEVELTGTKASVGFYVYPAGKAHVVQPEIESEFRGQLKEKHLAALGANGAIWSYHGAPADAWFTRGGQFVWIDSTLTAAKYVVRLAEKIYAKIG